MKIQVHSAISKGEIRTDQLAEWAFVLYFSNAMFRALFRTVFGISRSMNMAIMVLPLLPVLLICFKNPRKYVKWDFVFLFFGVVIFFGFTLLLHPDYKFYYNRSSFGVWDHVLKPGSGIYAYLFIRLIGEPKRIMKCMRTSGWLLMPYFIYQVYRGEWTTVGATGYNTESSYSVAFGYSVLVYVLIFLYSALKEKKIAYYAAALINTGLILLGGSLGPILFIGLFAVLYVLLYTKNSRKRAFIVFPVTAGVFLVYTFYVPVLNGLMNLLNSLGLSSRFIRMLLKGNIANDNNRYLLWSVAVQMIIANPFGYGAMGSRQKMYKYIFAAYPHSIILEFLIDYGVLIGGALLIFMFRNAFSILFLKKKQDWCGIFLCFFSAACCMLISLTYWARFEFWACLALGVCSYYDLKHKKKDGLSEPTNPTDPTNL